VKTRKRRVFGDRFGIPEGAIVEYSAIREVEFNIARFDDAFSHNLGSTASLETAALLGAEPAVDLASRMRGMWK